MRFWTHISFSLVIGLLIIPKINGNTTLLLASLMLGALLPDIDAGNSLIGKKIWIISWLFSHRGFFHSVIAAFALAFIPYVFFGISAAFAFLAGFFSHIFLDMLTKAGIMPFYPIKYRLRGPFRTGGFFELVLFLGTALGAVAIIFY